MWEKERVLIVAGGTGGHIFPAIVFGRWIEEQQKATVTYLSGGRPLEKEIYSSFGIEPMTLSLEGSPLGVRSPVRMLRRSVALAKALGEAARCIARTRPDVCVLFGGYVSLPPFLICRIRGVPVVVHEQNAVAGRVTRLAFRWGAAVTSGWEVCDGISAFTPVGVPVRAPEPLSKSCAQKRVGLELPEKGRVVGVMGGSLGSGELMKHVLDMARRVEKNDVRTLFLFLGEGPGSDLPSNVRFVGRQWDMNPFYSLCDALICRGGGSTLAEALMWGIPAVVVPWKGAAEGHQTRNALCFENIAGGCVWEESGGEPLESLLEKMLLRGKIFPSRDAAGTCSKLWRALCL